MRSRAEKKYLLMLYAAKNITPLEITILSKLHTLKYIIDGLLLEYNANIENINPNCFSIFKNNADLGVINPNCLLVFKNSVNTFFSAIKELSTEEQKLFDEIFNCNLEEKKERLKNIIRKKEILKWCTLLFKFIFIPICFGTALNTLYNFKKFNINKKDALRVGLISSVSALFFIVLSRNQPVVHF